MLTVREARYDVWKSAVAAVCALAIVVGLRLLVSAVENPNALWTIVQSCVAFRKEGHAPPGACTYVDLKDEVAVLKSLQGRWQFLAIPTVRVTGIEDHQVVTTRLPNFWALAWNAAEQLLPEPVTRDRSNIGLAVNSVEGRSQNQLHIHISCVKPAVVRALNDRQNTINASWSQSVPVGTHTYRVMRVEGATLEHVDPFLLLVTMQGAAQHMGQHTLAVTGATWDGGKKSGYYILDDFAHDTPAGRDYGHGEELLDEDCSAALAAAKSAFVVYDNMSYRGKPDTAAAGLVASNILYERLIWPKNKDLGVLPNHADFLALVRSHIGNPGPLVIDIEELPLKGPPETAQHNAQTLTTLADWAHEAAPGRVIGYYGTNTLTRIPAADMPYARELARHVDAFFPPMYTFDDDRAAWQERARAEIAEARGLDSTKPIYVYLWPQYHDGTPKQFQYLDADYWTFQLQTIRQLSDGLVLWGPSKFRWDDTTGWWAATQPFMQTVK